MKILEVYKNYKIMPNLETHQLRVAAVGKIILENLKKRLNDEVNVISACLLHDMGNIIKFNLKVFPEFLQPEGFEYWNNIRNQFLERYGDDEHIATERIVKELKISERTFELVSNVGFTRSERVLATKDISKMICLYSDQRVGPKGVLSIQERIEEGNKRYGNKYDDSKSQNSFDALKKIENQIFKYANIRPEDIIDEKVNLVIDELKGFEII